MPLLTDAVPLGGQKSIVPPVGERLVPALRSSGFEVDECKTIAKFPTLTVRLVNCWLLELPSLPRIVKLPPETVNGEFPRGLMMLFVGAPVRPKFRIRLPRLMVVATCRSAPLRVRLPGPVMTTAYPSARNSRSRSR